MKNKIPFSVILFLFLSNNLISQSWDRVKLLNEDNTILWEGIFFGDTGIIIGAGDIIKSNDYFNSFVIDSAYDSVGLGRLSFPNRDTGYLVSASLLKTVDGGNTWAPQPNGTYPSNYPNELLFVSPDTGYAGTNNGGGGFYSTYNGGMNWTDTSHFRDLELSGQVLRIHVMHDSIIHLLIIFSGSDYLISIIRSSDYGKTWSLISTIDRFPPDGYADFYFVDDTTIIVSTAFNILKSVNAGVSFAPVMQNNDSYGFPMQAIGFSGHDTGFVAYGESVYKTYDAGNTWTSANFSFAPDDSLNSITFLTIGCSQNAVVGTWGGDIYKMEPGCALTGIENITDGNSFNIYPNPTNSKLYGTINYPQKSYLQILAIDGREVIPPLAIQQNHFELDVSNLPAGLYFLVLQNDEGRLVRKFVKE